MNVYQGVNAAGPSAATTVPHLGVTDGVAQTPGVCQQPNLTPVDSTMAALNHHSSQICGCKQVMGINSDDAECSPSTSPTLPTIINGATVFPCAYYVNTTTSGCDQDSPEAGHSAFSVKGYPARLGRSTAMSASESGRCSDSIVTDVTQSYEGSPASKTKVDSSLLLPSVFGAVYGHTCNDFISGQSSYNDQFGIRSTRCCSTTSGKTVRFAQNVPVLRRDSNNQVVGKTYVEISKV